MAGRPNRVGFGKPQGDEDRKWAANLGLKFHTPEVSPVASVLLHFSSSAALSFSADLSMLLSCFKYLGFLWEWRERTSSSSVRLPTSRSQIRFANLLSSSLSFRLYSQTDSPPRLSNANRSRTSLHSHLNSTHPFSSSIMRSRPLRRRDRNRKVTLPSIPLRGRGLRPS